LILVLAVVLSRFLWTYGIEAASALSGRLRGQARRGDWRAATGMGWAGMRGVVTLAVALSLPQSVPGRDLILFSAFAVIFVTVLLQGSTLGPLIRWVNPAYGEGPRYLREPQVWSRLEAAQLNVVQRLAYGPDGAVRHPRLLEQYSYRAQLTKQFEDAADYPAEIRTAHYDVILAAVAAARTELLRLHRTGQIHDELLHELERDLDLQEISALHGRG
jgi:monovalent cation/hydrogen antiporter